MNVPKDERGRIKTTRTIQVEGHDDVWAGGDYAAVPMADGWGTRLRPDLPACRDLRDEAGLARSARTSPGSSTAGSRRRSAIPASARARRSATAPPSPSCKGVEITGLFAWFVWRFLLTYYFPSWDRRLRIITDWFIWPIVGRDIVELRSAVRRATTRSTTTSSSPAR